MYVEMLDCCRGCPEAVPVCFRSPYHWGKKRSEIWINWCPPFLNEDCEEGREICKVLMWLSFPGPALARYALSNSKIPALPMAWGNKYVPDIYNHIPSPNSPWKIEDWNLTASVMPTACHPCIDVPATTFNFGFDLEIDVGKQFSTVKLFSSPSSAKKLKVDDH